mmetsp:Transcript_81812/g.162371  ORF Transcript_81812/g.162371 Transcript_81812/m.162371 type:complete len:694 (-) Transcript_81812:176-2257(-)|eukprot:CAMPEP_0172668680 /NCGR_PEP_ID=MMETSP1074-20121228/9207_1 /TAXON_ID=2916 /ORGANISM="Ceratium fusus, Strain PA161109" /LENGTH=693 /DNA_ID=CAMNT_0013485353 /DNA_START=72 /DNA_END=2153 /DNA_ORIENTATION=+
MGQTNTALQKATRCHQRKHAGPRGLTELAGFPAEALPLLCALVVAKQMGAITEADALVHARDFAATCAEGDRTQQILRKAKTAGRKILAFAKLREHYSAGHTAKLKDLEDAAARLVAGVTPDTFDAAWLVGANLPLRDWFAEVQRVVPIHLADVPHDFFGTFIEAKYASEHASILRVLRHLFPQEGEAELNSLVLMWKSKLPTSSFWRAHAKLCHGPFEDVSRILQGRTLQDLISTEFLEQACTYFADNFAICIHGTLDEIAGEEQGVLELAALRAKEPLAPRADGHAFQQTIQVEVFTADGLKNPEYRLGDISSRIVVGNPLIKPYAEASCAGHTKRTRVVQATRGGQAKFGEALLFLVPLALDNDIYDEGVKIELAVFDNRDVQAVLRGDPLVGKGSLEFDGKSLATSARHQVDLLRGGKCHGTLTVRVGVLAPQQSFAALTDMSQRPLAEVAAALARVLAQPHGVDTILDARPSALTLPSHAVGLRETVHKWVVRLVRETRHLNGLSDDDALSHLGRMMRSAHNIVGLCVPCDAQDDDIQDLTAQWVRNIISRCCGTAEGRPGSMVNQTRLRLLLEAGQSEDVTYAWERLEGFGASLPEGTPLETVSDVVHRLQEAESTEEEEIFTGREIIQSRRVTPGLAAVVRRREGPGPSHVFFYDHKSIVTWTRQHMTDPSTREPLEIGQIFVLSP